MARHVWSRLYRGETSFDFVGRRRQWFALSALVIVAGMAALGLRGLNFGIDFSGGSSWQVQTSSVSVTQARTALGAVGRNATIETLGNGRTKTLQVQAQLAGSAASKAAASNSVVATLARLARVNPSAVSVSEVGPTWGSEITSKAIRALIVFFIAIGAYITFRFEWKMAAAALVAVLHDLVVTVGIYALVGFPVTPATVVAVLTILGYSLYDTIVVFDRVRENARGLGATGRLTYSETVNLSMNQVLMRSLNTSIVAILPILSILLIGAELLGATTLQEFGLALVIGLTTGAYSSIFIASPLLAAFKEREPRFVAIRKKLEARGEGSLLLTPAAVAAMTSGGGSSRPIGARAGGTRPGGGRAAGATPVEAVPAEAGRVEAGPVEGRVDAGPVEGRVEAGPVEGRVEAGPVEGRVEAGPVEGRVEAGPVEGRVEAGPVEGRAEAGRVAGRKDGPREAGPVGNGQAAPRPQLRPARPPAPRGRKKGKRR